MRVAAAKAERSSFTRGSQPPCDADEDGDDGEINADGVKLLRKMLAAGLTRYEPDPLAALAAVKRKGAA